MTQPEEQKVMPLPETVEVDNLDQFVQILTAWHAEKCAAVQHLLEVPEDTAFEIGEESLVLTGPALAGFKFGLEMAMMQLGTLPFVAELEEEPAAT